MRNTFINELEKLAVVDPSIYLLTGDLGLVKICRNSLSMLESVSKTWPL